MRDTIFTPRDLADRAAQYVIENGSRRTPEPAKILRLGAR